jgi:hypothetical protein
MKYVSFPWPSLEAALSVLTLDFQLDRFLERIKIRSLPSTQDLKLSKNVYLEKISQVVQ